ncbi:PKD domain-containing protein [Kitasatospora sp. NPDC127111]|uniref:PKD domain-containing protein n=1 Tax=Kitasatospora sp. NPDC127111 TaxID=3345363 RepID=UPI00362AF607
MSSRRYLGSAAAVIGAAVIGTVLPVVSAHAAGATDPGTDPTAAFTATQADQEVPRLTVTDASTGTWPITSYSFDFGDGTAPVTASTTPVTHTYATGGRFTVTETVVDDHGRSATSQKSVTVVHGTLFGAPLVAKFYDGMMGSHRPFVGLLHDRGAWDFTNQRVSGPPTGQSTFGTADGDIPIAVAPAYGTQVVVGVYRSGQFILNTLPAPTTVGFGQAGDIPVPAAWDHNGHDQLAVYRPSTATFAVRHDDGSVTTACFGDPGDLPVVGDWDRVGHIQLGIFRGNGTGRTNTFALRHDDGSVSTAGYGDYGDVPLVGDWQAAGRTTFGIYRPSTGTFALSNAYIGKADDVFHIASLY